MLRRFGSTPNNGSFCISYRYIKTSQKINTNARSYIARMRKRAHQQLETTQGCFFFVYRRERKF